MSNIEDRLQVYKLSTLNSNPCAVSISISEENLMMKEKLILASKSPRRAEILRAVGWGFETQAANIDEARYTSEDAVSYVKRLARTKAETVARKTSEGFVLGADTVVVIGEEILGQLRGDDDARRMLHLLSGQWHEVLTGVALVRARLRAAGLVDHQSTRVRFCEMSEEEIDGYVASGETRGKAGGDAREGIG